MSIPLLEVTPTTQNQRVEGYEIPDEDDPKIYRLRDVTSDTPHYLPRHRQSLPNRV